MKNSGLIFASIIGGAILGSTLTCFLKSAKGADMRSQAHDKIIRELKHLHAHLSNGMCNCSETGECSCTMDMPKEMGNMAPAMSNDDKNNG